MFHANRNNNFNFLRLFFAFLVIGSHSTELIDGNRHRELLTSLFHTVSFGELAVDGFFLLSGYLIIQSWLRKPRLGIYLKKRVLRVYPGYLVAALVCALIVGPLGSSNWQTYFANLHPLALIRSLLFLKLPAVPAVFAGRPYPDLNGAMWTITFEFRCYLLVCALGVFGLARFRWMWLILAIATNALPGLVVWSVEHLSKISHPVGSLIFSDPALWTRLCGFFSAGVCFYLWKDKIPLRTKWALASFGLLLLLLGWPETAERGLATVGAYFLFWFAAQPFPLLSRFRKSVDISYGVYLYGWPIQMLLLWYWPNLSPWGLFGVSSVLAASVGFLSWHWVEEPCLKLKSKRIGPALVPSDGIAQFATE